MAGKTAREIAAEVIRDAGGQVVGRTRLQKITYLLQLAGLGRGFHFEYRHYGPYSEDLADAVQLAEAFGLVKEEERRAGWGGVYSVYSVTNEVGPRDQGMRARFAEEAANIDPIELELAATAAYLKVVEGANDPWDETARRKPDKAQGDRIKKAREAYARLARLETPQRLPNIA